MHRPILYIILPIFVIFGMFIKGNPVTVEDEPTPKVYLNHFFLLVDSSTYKDIAESDFIKNEFAHFEERTTVVENNESYSGAYIYGKNTYFEFFNKSESEDFMPPGLTSGMACCILILLPHLLGL